MLNGKYLWRDSSCAVKNVHHKRNQVKPSVIAIETLGCSLFLSKAKCPHFQLLKVGQRILLGRDIVTVLCYLSSLD